MIFGRSLDMIKHCIICNKEYAGSQQTKYCFKCSYDVRTARSKAGRKAYKEKKRMEKLNG